MPLGMQSSDLFWPILFFFPALLPVVPTHSSFINDIQTELVPWATIKGSRSNSPRAAESTTQIGMQGFS
jgi:hypothetical protein